MNIYSFFKSRKWLFYAVFTAVMGALLFFASKVKLEENFMQMLPHDKNTEGFSHFIENSKFSDKITVCISAKDTLSKPSTDSMVAFSEVLAGRIKKDLGQYIQQLDYTINDSSVEGVMDVIDRNLPLFLDENDYKVIDSLTTEKGIQNKLAYNYRTLTGPTGLGLKKFIIKDPLGLNFIVYKRLKNFQVDDHIEVYDQHLVSKDRNHLLLIINPYYPASETSKNEIFFNKFDILIKELANSHLKYDISYFGVPVVASGNSAQIRKDTYLTVIITILLLILIVSIYFKKVSATILMLLPVVCGGLFALAFIFLLKGSISVIAVAAGSLILGIAVNYSLHFLTHYDYHPNVQSVIKELSFPMTIGSATTIGGFLCLQFVKAPVLRDLGLFVALSLIGAAISTLIFLPHFLPHNVNSLHRESKTSLGYFSWLHKLQSNKYFIWFFIILTPIFLYFAQFVKFENDMTKINYMSPQVKNAENTLNKVVSYYQKSIFVISKGESLDAALENSEKAFPIIEQLKKEGKITTYAGVSFLLPSLKEQEKRINKWNNYWTPDKKNNVLNSLINQGIEWHFKETAFESFKTNLENKFSPISNKDRNILKEAFLKNFIEENKNEATVIGIIKTKPENVKDIYSQMSIYPEVAVFDRQYVTNTLVKLVSKDFNFITIFSSLLVLIVLFLTYGRIELALITFIPMAISWIWILGIMTLLGIKFNIINSILSTLVFALGDDYCIFTMDGLQQEYSRGVENIKSVTTSISLSVVTTIIGLGILIFAKHPALNSIGLVSIVGILCVGLVSQTIQPALFNLLIKNRAKKKLAPYSLWTLLKTMFAFAYFVSGALLLFLIGVFLMKLLPGKKRSKRYLYHWILSKFAGSLMYIMTNVKKKIINEHRENFSSPAVVIANHQGVLDILILIMLNPKMILLTNKWVWKSPVFGYVVRMADYVVAEEAEHSLDRMEQLVTEGYSIAVFPEGTRSIDGKIQRFHKGAFLLAEKMKLDILPILIHGTNYTMTKGDFMLKDGRITVKYLDRININDTTYGLTYSERAKHIGKFFREKHEILSKQEETTSYYRNQLISNYLFKGPLLEWYMKIKLKLEKNYVLFESLLPKKGKILDIGCGYGFLSYMLNYTSDERKIIGIDYDEEKIEVANNGYLKGADVIFEQADAMNFHFEKYDGIIISDMLHYISAKDQVILIEKCLESLNETGKLVIRDGIEDLGKRHKITKLTEWFSTGLSFNKSLVDKLNFLSSSMINDIAAKHSFSVSAIDNTRFTSNVIFVLEKKS